jgi:poly(3-hydroxybutyrate) depolymerase
VNRRATLPASIAALLTALVLVGLASLPASADDPAPAAPPVPVVVAPYAVDQLGVPMFRVAEGQHLPSVHPSGHPFKAIVTVETADGDRTFRVFVPSGLVGPAPTLVAMGGYAQVGESESYMRWEPYASSRHVVVVYPYGEGLSYNAGRCCGLAVSRKVDDSAALIRMLQVEGDLYPQNPSRLYLTGFSNGGMMAYRFACEHPELVAAIGVVASAYVARTVCMPTEPVPAMHIHGLLDRTVPYRGTAWSSLLRTSLPTVPQTNQVFAHVDYWARVPYRNVELRSLGHAWPHLNGAGHYDATGALASFLFRFHK